jgi:hypothetical protein
LLSKLSSSWESGGTARSCYESGLQL